MSDASSTETPENAWRVTRAAIEDVRVAQLDLTGLPHIPVSARRLDMFFQPVAMELEYRRSVGGEWYLKRAEVSGPICEPDGQPGPDPDDVHIYAWPTPEWQTRADRMAPDWVLEIGRRYKPQDLAADRTTEK